MRLKNNQFLHCNSTYPFVTMFVLLFIFMIASDQVVLGQEGSSPFKEMNFSKPSDMYSNKQGILEASLIVEEKKVLVENQSVTALVYNGSLMAPTLHIKPGERLVVNLVNNLDQTNIHFHGLHVSPIGSSDNIFRVVKPGETVRYVIDIPINHPTGTFWYHPHLHGLATTQVGSGMSGLIKIEGLEDLLPGVLHNITQQTYILKAFPWSLNGSSTNSIYKWANYFTVNGQINPTINISSGETQLWQFANIDPATFYNITLPNYTFYVIAEDGNPVWEVWNEKNLVLPAGKRFDVLVTGGENGTYPIKSLPYNRSGFSPTSEVTLATVNVKGMTANQTEKKVTPSSLLPKHDLGDAQIQTHRTLVFNGSPDNQTANRFGDVGTNQINGKVFDHNRIDYLVKLGDVEEWTLKNIDDEDHTFHIHVNDFQVMSVNGQPYNAPGLQDIVVIPQGGEVVVRIPFTDFVGKFVFHCHILPHEDTGMMGIVEVIDPFTPR
ncbi:multicopper oxidase family protein [Candidatus Nitrosocosmicus hydrocola]|uniref:multicopper oxidase family protein n=1 Tax=Candidatus Nitrosocosmicus hydrocola TaxID=1826872 RepID=UPI0011E58A48|nr:multicopper oxidase family protein [Candidatus Nitrosocosmicus hydrocola]